MSARHHRLPIEKFFLRVRDNERNSLATRHDMAQETSGLEVCEVILSMRSRFDKQDLKVSISIRQPARDKACRGATYMQGSAMTATDLYQSAHLPRRRYQTRYRRFACLTTQLEERAYGTGVPRVRTLMLFYISSKMV